MTSDEFKAVMGLLQKYYGHELDNMIYKMYHKALKHLTSQQFKKAAENIVQSNFRPSTRNPFPLINDFLENAGQSTEGRAISIIPHIRNAVSRIGRYESINFGDTAIHAVIDRYGGWVRICDWSDDDWKMKEKAFIEAYKAESKNNFFQKKYLSGIHEANNSGLCHTKPVEYYLNGYNNIQTLEYKEETKQLPQAVKELESKFEEPF